MGKAWGCHHGAPLLNYQRVPCPPKFVERVRIGKAFDKSGVMSLSSAASPVIEVQASPMGRSVPVVTAAASILLLVGMGTLAFRRQRHRQQQLKDPVLLPDGVGPV